MGEPHAEAVARYWQSLAWIQKVYIVNKDSEILQENHRGRFAAGCFSTWKTKGLAYVRRFETVFQGGSRYFATQRLG